MTANYNQLARIAEQTNRPVEAEDWYRRALDYDIQANPETPNAGYPHNLARLLVSEVQARRANPARLVEARELASQALTIMERQDLFANEIWLTLAVLARIAEEEGQLEVARTYRRRERETFATFASHRYQFEGPETNKLIVGIVAAALGNNVARQWVEMNLSSLEEQGWHLTEATHRLWAGEREWQLLVEGLDAHIALLLLRVLEFLEAVPERVVTSLPSAVRDAYQNGDQATLMQEVAVLAPMEQQKVLMNLQILRLLAEAAERMEQDE